MNIVANINIQTMPDCCPYIVGNPITTIGDGSILKVGGIDKKGHFLIWQSN
jgi:hypothetical protein